MLPCRASHNRIVSIVLYCFYCITLLRLSIIHAPCRAFYLFIAIVLLLLPIHISVIGVTCGVTLSAYCAFISFATCFLCCHLPPNTGDNSGEDARRGDNSGEDARPGDNSVEDARRGDNSGEYARPGCYGRGDMCFMLDVVCFIFVVGLMC